MPIPKKSETKSEFISRCIPIVINEGTTDDPKQAAAICNSIWRKKHPGSKSIEKSSDVQALVFTKPKFNVKSAKSWAKSHGFKSNTSRETANTIRLRQFKPDECFKSGGMKKLDKGVQAYICIIKQEKDKTVKKTKKEKKPIEDTTPKKELQDNPPPQNVTEIPTPSGNIKDNEVKSKYEVGSEIVYKGKKGKIIRIIE